MSVGEAKQQLRDYFDDFAFGLGYAMRILGKLLDAFPFKITTRAVSVGCAFPVGEGWQAACRQHLHH
jgi:hypothetical protein